MREIVVRKKLLSIVLTGAFTALLLGGCSPNGGTPTQANPTHPQSPSSSTPDSQGINDLRIHTSFTPTVLQDEIERHPDALSPVVVGRILGSATIDQQGEVKLATTPQDSGKISYSFVCKAENFDPKRPWSMKVISRGVDTGSTTLGEGCAHSGIETITTAPFSRGSMPTSLEFSSPQPITIIVVAYLSGE